MPLLSRHLQHTGLARICRSPLTSAIRRAIGTASRRAAAMAQPLTEAPSGMDAEAKLLEEFTCVPILNKATLRPVAGGGVQAMLHVSQHNLAANSKRQLVHTAVIPDPSHPASALTTALPVELQTMALQSQSPSGKLMLIGKANNDSGVILEVWGAGRLLRELHVPKTLHGPLVNDGWFSKGAAWSPDESRIAYVAEVAPSERTPMWSGSEAKDAAAPKGWRGVGQVEEDWGELNTGKRTPAVYVLDLGSWQVTKVEGLPDDHSFGQPAWAPGGSGLVLVAWPHRPTNFPQTARRLGIVHCYNRPSKLLYAPYRPAAVPQSSDKDANKETHNDTQQAADASASAADGNASAAAPAVVLTPGLLSAASPLFTPDGSRLLFLSHEAAAASGVHCATAALCSLQWQQGVSSGEVQTMVGVVGRPATPSAFPGLYPGNFADNPFVSNSTLLLTSQWGSQTVVLAVDTDSGKVAAVTDTDATSGSWVVQGISNGVAAAIVSAPNSPPRLMVAPVPAANALLDANAWRWEPLEGAVSPLEGLPAVTAALADVETAVLDVRPTAGDASVTFQAIVQAPRSRSRPAPAIIFPHGGPHTGIAANYYMPFGFLTALGYCVVAVNYRGSLGFGEDNVQSLPGHVGTNDVQDCVDALDAAVAAGFADASQASVIGGSHGGFLAGHLMGQHPERFGCAVLRNPVVNIALMVGVSDIPDWCYIETFGTEEGQRRFTPTPTAADLERFTAQSPVAHISNMKRPMLLLLGAKDRRVPYADGLRFATALQSQGTPVQTIVFPEDTHALDKPQTEFEQWLNCAWWLKQHGVASS